MPLTAKSTLPGWDCDTVIGIDTFNLPPEATAVSFISVTPDWILTIVALETVIVALSGLGTIKGVGSIQ